MTVIPLKGANPDWGYDPQNLADLWRDLMRRGEEPDDAAYYMERWRKWHGEWARLLRERDTGEIA